MKYDISCKMMSFAFTKLLKQYYTNHYPNMDISNIVKDVKKEYKAIILRTPGLSKDNFMASNLKGAAYFFAMAKSIKDMTPSLMDEMINESMTSDFMKKLNKKKKESGFLFSQKYYDKMKKDSLRSQKSNDEMDWRYVVEERKENELTYTMTKCGVCQLAKQENLMEYLPCMCKMDYPKYALQGGELIRDKTLANNDECCNFHLNKMN